MPKILIVGGGYAGFYTARKLEKWLRRGEAQVTMVDPLPYMTYQPFLPDVAAGSIEGRHAVVALRRHLKKTEVITAKVTAIDHPDLQKMPGTTCRNCKSGGCQIYETRPDPCRRFFCGWRYLPDLGKDKEVLCENGFDGQYDLVSGACKLTSN